MKDQSSKEDTDPSKIVATNGPITLATVSYLLLLHTTHI